jgi:broad specificity phosphatase PhoE
VLTIGLVQCVALVPGVSRSGATISAGLLLGATRVTATRLSFFLAIPALTGAGLFELKDVDTSVVGWGQLAVGTAISFVVAYASIAWLLQFVAKHPISGLRAVPGGRGPGPASRCWRPASWSDRRRPAPAPHLARRVDIAWSRAHRPSRPSRPHGRERRRGPRRVVARRRARRDRPPPGRPPRRQDGGAAAGRRRVQPAAALPGDGGRAARRPGPGDVARPAPVVDDRLGECRYGDWTGRELKDLAKDPLWRAVQVHPSSVTFPGEGGEAMLTMAQRTVTALREHDARVAAAAGEHAIWVAVSHGDPIKAALADALGMHLDQFQRIVVEPGSVSVVRYTPLRPFVLRMNDTSGELTPFLPPPPQPRAARTPTPTRPPTPAPTRSSVAPRVPRPGPAPRSRRVSAMPRQVFEYDAPERFVAGTTGEPGARTFFLQARVGPE